jgi:hypothetical protein
MSTKYRSFVAFFRPIEYVDSDKRAKDRRSLGAVTMMH